MKKGKKQKSPLSLLFAYRYLFIFVFAFLLYANTIPNGYNLDDELVTRNHRITSQGLNSDNLHKIFTEPYYQDNMGYSYGYRPLTLLSFTIENWVFGENPNINHFFNVIFYSLLCLILLKTLEKILSNYSKSLILVATIIFAAHPIHTEVVASIKNRDEILSFLFGILSFFFLFSEIRSFYLRLIFSVACFIAGMLCKPDIIMLPPLMVIAVILFRKEVVLKVILMSVLFSLASLFFMEEIASIVKLYYIFASFTFTAFVIGLVNDWFTFDYRVNKILLFFSGTTKKSDSAKLPRKIALRGYLYLIILAANIGLAVWIIKFTQLFTNPLFFLPLAAIYGLELYFFPFWQVLPVAIGVDAFSLFLLEPRYTHLIAKSFIPLFIIFNFSLLLDLRQRLFWMLFAFSTTFMIVYMYYASNDSTFGSSIEIFVTVVSCAILPWAYRSKFYKTPWAKILVLIAIFINGLWVFNAVYNPAGTQNSVLTVMGFLIVASVPVGIYFNGSAKRLSALLGFIQFLFIIIIFYFYPYILNPGSAEKLNSLQSSEGHFRGQIGSEINLPSAHKDLKIHRPLTLIELPVQPNDPLNTKIATSAYQFARYMVLLVKPWPMRFYYGYKEIEAHHLEEPLVIVSIILFIGMLLTAIALLTRNKLLSFAVFFTIFSLIPYLVIVVSIPGMLADRYLFQASLGFALFVSACLTYFYNLPGNSFLTRFASPQTIKQIVRIFFVVLILCYTTTTLMRNMQWKDPVTLMRHDIKYLDQSAQAHNLLAIHLVKLAFDVTDLDQQRFLREDALEHLKRARNIFPGYFNYTYDIGRVYSLLNMPDSALVYYKAGILQNPKFVDAYNNIAEIYLKQAKLPEAIPFLQEAIVLSPKEYDNYGKLSLAYFQLNEFDKSIQVNEKAMLEMPVNALPAINLGRTFLRIKQTDSAGYYLQKADAILPGNQTIKELLLEIRK